MVERVARRRMLKVHPEPDAMLEELIRALERLATGVENVVETLESLIEPGEEEGQQPRLRTVDR
jgi:hypothetical protein